MTLLAYFNDQFDKLCRGNPHGMMRLLETYPKFSTFFEKNMSLLEDVNQLYLDLNKPPNKLKL